jgi:hypothetical protein
MYNGEHEPGSKQPDASKRQEVQRVGMPVIVYDRMHTVAVSRNDKGSLLVRISAGDEHLFTAAVSADNDVHTLTPGKKKQPAQRQAQPNNGDRPPLAEQKELLPLPITIEGYPVRSAKYDEKEQRFGLTIAHHPDPEDRKNKVVYYDLVAEGEKAAQFYALRLTDTRTAVHITGIDRSQEVPKKGSKTGEKKQIHLIEAESIERIAGRMDSPEILREKVKLSDQQ